jgi:hypothetical protein
MLTDDEIFGIFQADPDDGTDECALRIGRAIAQAARAAALEEAAERVMKILGYQPREYYAEAIRALANPEGETT